MPKVTSSLTNKTISGSSYKTIEIPDETGYSEEPAIDFVTIDAHRIKRGLPPLDEHIKRQMLQAQNQDQSKAQTFTSTVPEEEMTIEKLSEIEKKLQAAKQAKSSGLEKLSFGAKNRIDALLGTSRSIKDVEIEGIKFTIQGLKGKAQRAAIVKASEYDGTAHAAFEIRRQLLARAIIAVNGTDFELYLGTHDIEAQLEFVEELEEPMLNKLYSEYLEMVQETQNKYFIKNDQDVKEVVEDLKK